MLALCTAALFVAGRRVWAAVAACGAAINLALVAPIYWPAAPAAESSPRLEMISFNLLSRNRRYADVLAYLRREEADLVLLLEVNPEWAEQLETLNDIYAHRHVVPRSDNFGIALLAKQPWKRIAVRGGEEGTVPSLVAECDHGGKTLTLIGTHPVPPGSEHRTQQRNRQLRDIAQWARDCPGPVMVAGDLNITEYSPYYGDLLRTAQLHDSRQGFGVQASWSPGSRCWEIAIDHCLLSQDLVATERSVGPDLGSDHRPIRVVVQ